MSHRALNPQQFESVAHILGHYAPTDAPTWSEVSENYDWQHPEMKSFVEDVRQHGVKRPIPIDYEESPPRVYGHTRVLAAHRAGVRMVPVRQYEHFMDPDMPDWLGRQPDHPHYQEHE